LCGCFLGPCFFVWFVLVVEEKIRVGAPPSRRPIPTGPRHLVRPTRKHPTMGGAGRKVTWRPPPVAGGCLGMTLGTGVGRQRGRHGGGPANGVFRDEGGPAAMGPGNTGGPRGRSTPTGWGRGPNPGRPVAGALSGGGGRPFNRCCPSMASSRIQGTGPKKATLGGDPSGARREGRSGMALSWPPGTAPGCVLAAGNPGRLRSGGPRGLFEKDGWVREEGGGPPMWKAGGRCPVFFVLMAYGTHTGLGPAGRGNMGRPGYLRRPRIPTC